MTTVYKPIEFVIDGLLAQGLYILAGAPKVGKSWLALDMCLSIAKGESVLGQKTLQGTALYLCLEDSYVRIQNRLYEITDVPTENLYFSVMSESIGNGLEEQIESFKIEHRDLKSFYRHSANGSWFNRFKLWFRLQRAVCAESSCRQA